VVPSTRKTLATYRYLSINSQSTRPFDELNLGSAAFFEEMRSSIRNQPLGGLIHLEQYAADFEDDTDLMILVWSCVICVIPGQNQISEYALLEANWGNKTEEQLGNRTRPTP